MEIFHNSNFVVGIAFVCFIAVLFYYKVPSFLASKLDARAAAIREELEEARRIREEAQSTLAMFERKQKEAESQVEDIVSHARLEAEEAAADAKEQLKLSIERRLKAAEEQIAAAESNAVREVKNKAVAVAIAAAGEVIAKNMNAETRGQMIDESIEQVAKRLH